MSEKRDWSMKRQGSTCFRGGGQSDTGFALNGGERRETSPLSAALGLEAAFESGRGGPFGIALVGGGGKTSTMTALAAEAAAAGRRVLVATSTHIGLPSAGPVLVYRAENDCLELWEGQKEKSPGILAERLSIREVDRETFREEIRMVWGGVLAAGTLEEKNGVQKLTALPENIRRELLAMADVVLTEADGSRHHPIKAPAAHEPVIPAEADAVLGCMGLSAIGRPAGEVFFRREILEISPEETVTEELAADVLSSEWGAKKGIGSRLYRAVLNQCDGSRQLAGARRMGRRLAERGIHGAALCWGRPVWKF